MIVLDTNVLSALMQTRPDAEVAAWLDQLAPETIWTTSVTVFEIRFGLELLAQGRRRKELEQSFARSLEEDFGRRVLCFDQPAALAAAGLAARRRREGRPVELRDTQIAGIVTVRRAALATRNTRHFADLDVDLIDPWQAARSE